MPNLGLKLSLDGFHVPSSTAESLLKLTSAQFKFDQVGPTCSCKIMKNINNEKMKKHRKNEKIMKHIEKNKEQS